MAYQAVFSQLNLVTRNMAAALAFYRRLGVAIEGGPDDDHVEGTLADRLTIEWDSQASVRAWDSGWASRTGGSTVLGFSLPSRAAVDEMYAELTAAGGGAHQPPYDAFFGARYAIVDDPDGNHVGLMSPIDPERRYWPPRQPPAAPSSAVRADPSR
jgi:predicted lactoylglutathione lyase